MGGLRIIAGWTIVLGLVACLGCGQHSANPVVVSKALSKSAEKYLRVPTDGPYGGSAPPEAVVPFGTRIPAGMPITVRLHEPLSSANARPGQVFEGIVDENVILDGQVLLERGSPVRGRVVESAARHLGRTPGYLRLALTEVSVDGKPRPIRTYGDFFKGAGSVRRSIANNFPGERLVAETAVLSRSGATDADDVQSAEAIAPPRVADVRLGVNRRLTFHLLEPLSLFPTGAYPFSAIRP